MPRYRAIIEDLVDAEQFLVDSKPWPKGVTLGALDEGTASNHRHMLGTKWGGTLMSDGDWILTNAHGSRAVIKDLEFKQLYEPVEKEPEEPINDCWTMTIGLDQYGPDTTEACALEAARAIRMNALNPERDCLSIELALFTGGKTPVTAPKKDWGMIICGSTWGPDTLEACAQEAYGASRKIMREIDVDFFSIEFDREET